MKIKIMMLLLALALACSIAVADEAAHRANTEALLLLVNADDSIKAVWDQVEAQMKSQFNQMGGSEDLKPVLTKYLAKMRNVYEEELAWDKIKNDFIDIYMKIYTEDEIKGILAFYKSPVGRKYAEKMPQLIQESMTVTKKIMPGFSAKMQQISREMYTEMQQPPAAPQIQ